MIMIIMSKTTESYTWSIRPEWCKWFFSWEFCKFIIEFNVLKLQISVKLFCVNRFCILWWIRGWWSNWKDEIWMMKFSPGNLGHHGVHSTSASEEATQSEPLLLKNTFPSAIVLCNWCFCFESSVHSCIVRFTCICCSNSRVYIVHVHCTTCEKLKHFSEPF